jgi:hypothetical protein
VSETRVMDPDDLLRAVELVTAAYEEAMRQYGLVKGTRAKISSDAKLNVIKALAEEAPGEARI